MKKFKQAVAVILCVTMLSSVLTIAPVTACASETSQKESTAFESGVSFYTEATPEAASETTETIETQPETAMPVKEAIGEAVGVEAPEPAQEDGFTFVISEGCAAITAYEGDRSVTHLVIPNQLGGCPVTAIRENVFSGADYLQEVVISDSVTEIGGNSFGGCTALNHIQLPSKLEKLGPLAFNGCTGLTEITLPKTLTTVDVDWNYTSPFVRCENLKKVVFEAGMAAVPAYICRDVTSLEEVVIPEGVTVIGQYAFQNCAASLISNLNLPQSICEIRSGAFGAGEFELSLPDNIRLVASNAFGCDVVARNGSRTVVTLINSGHPFSFTAKNKPEMPVLNVLESHMELTSTSKLKIKCSYSVKDDEFEKLSDMYVKIRLPEFAELDYDTIYIDKQKLTDFRVENRKDLVIPVAAKSGKITFQLDTLDVSEEEANANDLRLYAIMGYTADGKQDYDVIDTIIDSFNTLTLTAPEEFSESFIEVSGIAPAGRIVSICIDGMERTRLQANKAGKYSGIFPMTASEMKDGQKLSLQAVITGSNGEPLDAWAYTKFRERTPKLTEFTMLYNGKTYDLLAGKQYNLTFILEQFHGAHPFEFRVKYTETDVIESVKITSTRNGRKESLKAVYDPKKDMYVAKGYFNDEDHDYVPGIIGVEYQRHTPEKSLEQISEEMDKLSQNPLLRNAEIDVVENQDSHKVLNATFEDCGSLQYVFDAFTALEFIEEYLAAYPEKAEPIIRRYLETHPVGSAKSQSEAVGAPASEFVGGFVGLIDSLREFPDTNLAELVIEFFDAASESRA